MEYLIRSARITDIERLVALSDGAIRRSGDAGTLVPDVRGPGGAVPQWVTDPFPRFRVTGPSVVIRPPL